METLDLKKGFKLSLSGLPDNSVIHLSDPETVAVSAMDIPYIRPKLLVKENDPVKLGTPLFHDKRRPDIVYLSPGAGRVRQIVFGPRRRLIEVVIALDEFSGSPDQAVEFETLTKQALKTVSTDQVVRMLKTGGLWQCLRQFPSRGTADSSHEPTMIIVSLNGNDFFSPHPGILLENEASDFEYGLDVLKLFSKSIVVTCRKSSLERLDSEAFHITHVVPDIFPSWDPKSVLYHLKKDVSDNSAWCIGAEHLLLLAKLLKEGRYPVKRMVSVTRTGDKKPHIITRQGAPVRDLIGRTPENAVVTTGRFNGRIVDPDTHLGFFESTLNIIDGAKEDEMFGFVRPGLSKPTVSWTFLSRLVPAPRELDCTLHGEQRACINCGYCMKICPVDLAPNFIMKALLADDIEEALSLGLLDCCRCGLCAFACPSKIELTQILSDGMDMHFKDKE